jgi:hypothetical protein
VLAGFCSVPVLAQPPAPGNFTATAGVASIALSWSASTGADVYRIYIDVATRSSTELCCQVLVPSARTSQTIDGDTPNLGLVMQADVEYRVVLTACDGSSPRKCSSAGEKVVRTLPRPPDAPGNLQVVPGEAKLTMSWTAPVSWGSWAAHGYWIQWQVDTDGNNWSSWRKDGDGNTVRIFVAHPGTSYEFSGVAITSLVAEHAVSNGKFYDLRVTAVSDNPSSSKVPGAQGSAANVDFAASGWTESLDNEPTGITLAWPEATESYDESLATDQTLEVSGDFCTEITGTVSYHAYGERPADPESDLLNAGTEEHTRIGKVECTGGDLRNRKAGVLLAGNSDDTENEHDETFSVTINPGTGYVVGDPASLVVTIVDDDPPASPAFSLSAENDSSTRVKWTRPRGPLARYELRYRLRSGNAPWVTETYTVSESEAVLPIAPGEYWKMYELQMRADDGQTAQGNGWGDWGGPAVFWQSELVVDEKTVVRYTTWGCSELAVGANANVYSHNCSSGMADRHFELQGATYAVTTFLTTEDHVLIFRVDRPIPELLKRWGVLHLDGVEYTFAAAHVGGGFAEATWYRENDWTDGQKVQVGLSVRPPLLEGLSVTTPPSESAVELESRLWGPDLRPLDFRGVVGPEVDRVRLRPSPPGRPAADCDSRPSDAVCVVSVDSARLTDSATRSLRHGENHFRLSLVTSDGARVETWSVVIVRQTAPPGGVAGPPPGGPPPAQPPPAQPPPPQPPPPSGPPPSGPPPSGPPPSGPPPSGPPPPPPPPPPPAGPPRAAIETAASCEAELCRARTGAAVPFRDASTGAVRSRLWDFGDGGRSRGASPVRAWSSPGFHEVTLTVSDGTVESTASLTFLVEAAEPAGSCAADERTRCLGDSRYAVSVDWRAAAGEEGRATVVRAGTNDSGLFWFFDRDNWEVLIKVLDGCGVNGRAWVFAASTTDLGFTIRVEDTATGEVKEYRAEPGAPASAITDMKAFSGACRSGPSD